VKTVPVTFYLCATGLYARSELLCGCAEFGGMIASNGALCETDKAACTQSFRIGAYCRASAFVERKCLQNDIFSVGGCLRLIIILAYDELTVFLSSSLHIFLPDGSH
jgi:hypothetical protein